MNVWHLDLPDAESDSLPTTDEGLVIEREALLWDLAGQEDYRLIHQLYLEETALALLLVNPQKDDPFAEAGDWLKALSMSVSRNDRQREVAKLLIATRLDVGGMKLSRQKIDRFLQEHGFAGFLETGAKRGDNCSDRMNGDQPSALKQLIAHSIFPGINCRGHRRHACWRILKMRWWLCVMMRIFACCVLPNWRNAWSERCRMRILPKRICAPP